MEGIKISKRPRLKDPVMICAWPGMGEVAFKSALYLKDALAAEEFASLDPQDFFYLNGSAVSDGILNSPELPYSKFYYWKNRSGRHDLVIFLSSAQPDLARAEDYTRKVLGVAGSFKASRIICFAAAPQPIDHTHEPGVWFAATSRQIKDELKKHHLAIFPDGQISGMNGLFLGMAKARGMEGFCLLGEIPLYTIQIDNPKASLAVLKVLCRVLDIKIDFHSLISEAVSAEEEINKLLEYLKIDTASPSPIDEEEIARLKKGLMQLTKLPGSVKERIEKLFSEVGSDISKAGQLKIELDKWNVYREYEDRFLDLFKKRPERNN